DRDRFGRCRERRQGERRRGQRGGRDAFCKMLHGFPPLGGWVTCIGAQMTCRLLKLSILSGSKPHLRSVLSVSAPGAEGGRGSGGGVRLNRGVGAGCPTPAISVKIPSARLWGCS